MRALNVSLTFSSVFPIVLVPDIEFSCQTLSTVRDILEDKENPDDMTLEDALEEANMSLENYEKALSTTKSGESIILRRKSIEKRTNC